MAITSADHLLARLEEARGRFDPGDAARTERLLETLGRRRFRDPKSLVRFHEALLFLRAFPHSANVVRQTEALLSAFRQRVEGLRRLNADLSLLDAPEVSGIAGTAIRDTLNYDVVCWLLGRFPDHVDVVWEDYEGHNRLAQTLPRFLPLLEDDAYVEADVPYLQWLRAAEGGSRRDLAWLVRRFENLPLSLPERAELYDSLGLTVRWRLDNLRASRTRNRRPVRKIFYHGGPLVRRNEVFLAKEIGSPRLPVKRLSPRDGEGVLDLVKEVLTVRYRELWGTTRGDPRRVVQADVGRGVQIFLWGLPPERRLPLRAYLAGCSLKNGVPINYIEAIGLFEWIEVGFNTFYTFRDGESAWIYAQVLRLLHQTLGVTCFSVYPYQIGLDNEEAIQSGAFWFYRKLGFRPGRPELMRISEREEKRIAARPGYRTPARTLRKLATGHMFFELPGTMPGTWDRFQIRNIGFAVQQRMAERFTGDAKKARDGAVAAVARLLGVRRDAWAGHQRTAFENFALVLALVPDLADWTPGQKKDLVRILRAKAGPEESSYLRLMQRHAMLRDAIVTLGS
jgi:hypothetical protein